MKEFETSLLREKFIIRDPKTSEQSDNKATIALSNRMVVVLMNDQGNVQEEFIVRAQNMHSCVRIASRIVQSFIQAGPLLNRNLPYDWENAWAVTANDYEQSYNPHRWLAIYADGKTIFKDGEFHPLLDLIERFNHEEKGNYERAIPLAEEVFKNTGKVVNIEYNGNVALTVKFSKEEARCGIILRGPDRTNTFNFNAFPKNKSSINFPQCLKTAAAFLEGMQLSFMAGMNSMKIQMGLIERGSPEEKQTRAARKRIAKLGGEIAGLENTHDVHYRPERPDFQKVIMEAEKLGAKVLTPAEDSDFIN